MRYAAAAVAAVLVLAGCGGGGTHTPSPPRKLPPALAQTWAQQADAVAAEIDAGNGCGAQQLAQRLRDDVIAAESRLPARYRPVLLAAVNDLADRITCAPPVQTVTVPPAGPPGHEKPKHHGHGKKGDG